MTVFMPMATVFMPMASAMFSAMSMRRIVTTFFTTTVTMTFIVVMASAMLMSMSMGFFLIKEALIHLHEDFVKRKSLDPNDEIHVYFRILSPLYVSCLIDFT